LGSRATSTDARTRLNFASTSAPYSRAMSASHPCRPRRTTACTNSANSRGASLSASPSSRALVPFGTRGEASTAATTSELSTAAATASSRPAYSSSRPDRSPSVKSASA